MPTQLWGADHKPATGNSFTTRLDKAHALAATGEIVKSGNAWLVPSASSELVYRVTFGEHGPECTCEDFKRRHAACKHLLSAAIVAQQESAA